MTAAARIEAVQVLGAGRMGQGIALAFAFAGLPVTLIDAKPREAGGAALREDRVLFEAVPEVLDAKLEALRWAEAHLPADAVIASATSTFLVTELQSHVARPGRLLNAHWLNPAHLIPLVEISRSDRTDADAVALTRALLERIGKRPVVCAPAAGYIVPRIQALAMNEAARMVDEGVASAAEIDEAIRTGFGLRFAVLGLLEFIDWGGRDILFHASNYLSREIDPRFAPAGIVARHMAAGRDGLRTGSGFYAYRQADTAAYVQARIGAFGALLDHIGLAPQLDAAVPPRAR